MSLDYDLEFEQNIEPKKLLQLLVDLCGFQWQQTGISGFGLWINAYQEEDEDSRILMEETQFVPRTVVSFSFRSKEDLETEERTLIRSVMILLQKVSGNAILLFNYESIVCQRIKNRLIFNKKFWEKYTANEVFQLGISYELKELSTII